MKKVIKNIKFVLLNLDAIELFDYLAETGYPDISHLLEGFIYPSTMLLLRKRLSNEWNLNSDLNIKTKLAKEIIAEIGEQNRREELTQTELDQLIEEEEENEAKQQILTSSFLMETTTYSTIINSLTNPEKLNKDKKSTTIRVMEPDSTLNTVTNNQTSETTKKFWFTTRTPQGSIILFLKISQHKISQAKNFPKVQITKVLDISKTYI